MRTAIIERKSKETDIKVKINLDGSGKSSISTGVGFLNHMLELFAFHSKIDMDICVKGDLHIDSHHTIEDTAIVLGDAIASALGDRIGINRYGSFFLPMDESLARVVIDISGRGYLVFDADLPYGQLGNYDIEMTKEFFYTIAMRTGMTIHISLLYGINTHHKIEAIFKGFARAFKIAKEITGDTVSSTKGLLD